MTEKQAEKLGYRAVTEPYMAGERHLLDKVIADMKKSDIAYTLVPEEGGTTLWRK